MAIIRTLPNTLRHPFAIATGAGLLSGTAVIAFDRHRPDSRMIAIELDGAEPGDPSSTVDPFSRRFDEIELVIREHDGEAIAAKLDRICAARRAA